MIVQKYVGTQNWVKGVLSTLIRFPSIFVISSLAQQLQIRYLSPEFPYGSI